MSITTNNIKNPDCLLLMEIAEILSIGELQLKYYESIFEIKINERLIGVINYKFVPSMRKNVIYIRNIYYTGAEYLDIMIKELCKYFKDHIIKTNIKTNPISEECILVMHNNNFKGDEYIFYNN